MYGESNSWFAQLFAIVVLACAFRNVKAYVNECDSGKDESTMIQLLQSTPVGLPATSPMPLEPLLVDPYLKGLAAVKGIRRPQVRSYYYPANGDGATDKVINIGCVLPLPNGPSSVGLGISLEQAYTDAIQHAMNKSGGIKLPGGQDLYGVAFHVVGQPTIGSVSQEQSIHDATAAMEYMISDDFPVFVHYIVAGPQTTYSFAPLIDVMVKQTDPLKRKVVITGASAVTSVIDKYDRAFALLGPGEEYMTAGVAALVDKGAQTFFLASDGTAFPNTACEGIRKYQQTSNSFTIVNTENYLIPQENNSEVVKQSSASGADVFVICTEYVSICAALLAESRKQNYRPKGVLMLFCGGDHQFDLTQETNHDAAFVTFVVEWFVNQPGQGTAGSLAGTMTSEDFSADFGATYMYTPPYMSPACWVGMALLLQAVEKVGMDYQAVTDEIFKTNVRTFYANVVFNLTDPVTAKRSGQINLKASAGQYNGNMDLIFAFSLDPVLQAGADPAGLCYPMPAWGCNTCNCTTS